MLPRRLALPVAVALVAGAGWLAPAHAGQATDSWKVPASATVVFLGKGYGHGHGMSQYGAEGAARQGLGHRDILGFYYPGTTFGKSGGKIRVLLTADTTPDVVVVPRDGLRVRDLAARTTTILPVGRPAQWRLVARKGGGTVLHKLVAGQWRAHARYAGEAQFSAGGRPIELVTPSGTAAYRGALRAVVPDAGASNGPKDRDTVNVLGMQAYLRGVVPLEMPASWSPAAVQAQSVAARTYAAYIRANPRRAHYDICDTTSCQVYGGHAAEHPGSDAAVRATRGEVLLADDSPAFTQFSASSGGWTAAGSMPYLAAQADPYDGWAGNPVHEWRYRFTDRQVERKMPALGDLRRIKVASRDGHGDWGGRITSVTFVGSKGSRTMSGDEMRWTFGLRSTLVTFRVRQR